VSQTQGVRVSAESSNLSIAINISKINLQALSRVRFTESQLIVLVAKNGFGKVFNCLAGRISSRAPSKSKNYFGLRINWAPRLQSLTGRFNASRPPTDYPAPRLSNRSAHPETDSFIMATSQLRAIGVFARSARLSQRAFSTSARQFEAAVSTKTNEASPAPIDENKPAVINQAPNRAGVWSRSQKPRAQAMTGPRFEQTDFDLQVQPTRELWWNIRLANYVIASTQGCYRNDS
jgi:hypothetical protein